MWNCKCLKLFTNARKIAKCYKKAFILWNVYIYKTIILHNNNTSWMDDFQEFAYFWRLVCEILKMKAFTYFLKWQNIIKLNNVSLGSFSWHLSWVQLHYFTMLKEFWLCRALFWWNINHPRCMLVSKVHCRLKYEKWY